MTETLLTLLGFYLWGAGITGILLAVMLRTLECLGAHHGFGRRHLIVPTLLWPVTVMSLGLWYPTDARRWWE